jgi:hypothetical protein
MTTVDEAKDAMEAVNAVEDTRDAERASADEEDATVTFKTKMAVLVSSHLLEMSRIPV